MTISGYQERVNQNCRATSFGLELGVKGRFSTWLGRPKILNFRWPGSFYFLALGMGGQSFGLPWYSALATSCRAGPLPSAMANLYGRSAGPDHRVTPA